MTGTIDNLVSAMQTFNTTMGGNFRQLTNVISGLSSGMGALLNGISALKASVDALTSVSNTKTRSRQAGSGNINVDTMMPSSVIDPNQLTPGIWKQLLRKGQPPINPANLSPGVWDRIKNAPGGQNVLSQEQGLKMWEKNNTYFLPQSPPPMRGPLTSDLDFMSKNPRYPAAIMKMFDDNTQTTAGVDTLGVGAMASLFNTAKMPDTINPVDLAGQNTFMQNMFDNNEAVNSYERIKSSARKMGFAREAAHIWENSQLPGGFPDDNTYTMQTIKSQRRLDHAILSSDIPDSAWDASHGGTAGGGPGHFSGVSNNLQKMADADAGEGGMGGKILNFGSNVGSGIVAGVRGIVGAIAAPITSLGSFANLAKFAGKQFMNTGKDQATSMLVTSPIQKFIDGFLEPFSFLGDFFEAYGEILGTMLIPLINEMIPLMVQLMPPLLAFAQFMGDLIGQAIGAGGAFSWLLEPLRSLVGLMNGTVSPQGFLDSLTNFQANILAFWPKIVSFVADTLKNIDWGLVITALLNFGATLITNVTNAIAAIDWKEVPKQIITWLGDVLAKIDWNAVGETAKQFGIALLNFLITGVKAAFDLVTGIGEIIVDWIRRETGWW